MSGFEPRSRQFLVLTFNLSDELLRPDARQRKTGQWDPAPPLCVHDPTDESATNCVGGAASRHARSATQYAKPKLRPMRNQCCWLGSLMLTVEPAAASANTVGR